MARPLADLPLTVLSGIGPARAAAFERLGLASIAALLLRSPRHLEVRGPRLPVTAAREAEGQEVSVVGTIGRPSFFRRGGRRSVLRVTVRDEAAKMNALWFNQPWLRDSLRALADGGDEVELYGRVVATRSGPALTSPRIGTAEQPLPPPGSLHPQYALTEGLGQAMVQRAAAEATERFAADLEEPLPASTLQAAGLPPLSAAARAVHVPPDAREFAAGRRRLALETILGLQSGLHRVGGRDVGAAPRLRLTAAARRAFLAALPFAPTAGQERVLAEILADLARLRPMRRLLQGEVGSGKTLVAALAACTASSAGAQAAILVPTELLAEQHHLELAPRFASLGIDCVLHTGSRKPAARRDVLERIATGAAGVVVGTHALFGAGVRFHRLGLAVIDEQQRFGVEQKRSLLEKGRDVHMLLMSATPIPRTLALTLYGDLDVSLLPELPPGRSPVATEVIPPPRRRGALAFLRKRLLAGERAFWVCPRIEADDAESATVTAAEEAFAGLATSSFAEFGVQLIHGRIPAEERARRIQAFRTGDTRLLVGTTIVEVGIDVPEATVMVIDGAERFGLAQLHQLRGRVGRGREPGWCLLFAAKDAAEGLRFLEETTDGFAIAERDLAARGMGDLAGRRQAGGAGGSALDPVVDEELLLLARRLLVEDPSLAARYADRLLDTPAIV